VTIRALIAAAILAPVGLVGLAMAASAMAIFAGGDPLVWPAARQTLSEAVALRDLGDVAHQILDGVDPDARYPVRDTIVGGQVVDATPLEASIDTHERYMFEILLDYGATLDASNARTLYCLALAEESDDIAELLVDRFGEFGDCAGVTLPW
jgi:hypothetical protein